MTLNVIYFLNGISALAIAVISFYIFFLWFKKKAICKLGKLIGINGIFYLIPTFLNFAWSFNLLFPQKNDFILIEGCFNVIKATLLLVIVYKLVNNKNLLYFLFLFLLSSIAIPYTINAFFLFISAASYLLILIISMELVLFSNYHLKKAGYFGILYSLISVLFLVFVFIGKKPSSMFWFIPNIAMFSVFLLFYVDVKHCGISVKKEKPGIKRVGLPLLFVKFLVFIISMSAFIFISTLAVHELGHALAAQYYGCERGKAVIYDLVGQPRTEMVCEGYYNNTVITLGGIILTFAVGFIFLLTGGKFTTIISYLIFGFSSLMVYGDLKDLNISMNIIATIMFISIILIITGIIKLSINYIKQQSSFYKSEKEMAGIDPENYFWLDDNTPIRNLYELVEVLHKMGNITFKDYVNDKKNDFSEWVKNKLNDNELAAQLLKAKDKKETEAVILTKLLKEETTEKNILKFICYPLLKDKTKVGND